MARRNFLSLTTKEVYTITIEIKQPVLISKNRINCLQLSCCVTSTACIYSSPHRLLTPMEIYDSLFMFAYDLVDYISLKFLPGQSFHLPRVNFSNRTVKLLTSDRKLAVDNLCHGAMDTNESYPNCRSISSREDCFQFMHIFIDLYMRFPYSEELFLELCSYLAFWSFAFRENCHYQYAPYAVIEVIFKLLAGLEVSGSLSNSTSWVKAGNNGKDRMNSTRIEENIEEQTEFRD